MARYNVEMTVSFSGEIEASSREEAEQLAIYDDTVLYSGVEDITITEEEEEDSE
tara:strand:- start:172 stop:333 length:162 start_codon:yes stop_codon:yes gene_type:complete